MYTTPAPSHTAIHLRYQKVTRLVSVVLVVTEMEIVVLGVTNTDEEDNQVNDGLGSRVLAEVLGLVSAEETLSLDLGGGTSGKLLVEADDTLHADSIRSGANGLGRSDLGRNERRERSAGDEAHDVGISKGSRLGNWSIAALVRRGSE